MSEPQRETTATITGQSSPSERVPKTSSQDDRIEIFINGIRVEVTPELEAAVQRMHKGLLQPLPTEMTTTQAADFLDVSRPFLIKLIDRGVLPYRMVGKHRRIPTTALEEYREKMYQRAKAAADEMAQQSQELGLYELGDPPLNPQ